ncbi:MAG: hypothetical protein FJX52_07235 [Alphaproteobacteria bacterium]|nr:hypothetical protein [Alphaproteobacteria bacterium]
MLAVRDVTDASARLRELTAAHAAAQQAHAEAEHAHARLVDAIESLTDGFMLWDAEDRLVLHNALAARADLDVGSQLTPGVTFTEIMRRRAYGGHIPDAWNREEEFVKECVARHLNPNGRLIERRYDDGRWLSIRELRTRDGGIVNIAHDVTEAKLREQELSEARAIADSARHDAEAANIAKSRFLSSMSHELRTPLNAVIGFAQMLELDLVGKLDAKQKEYCRHIISSGQHLVELVNDVLDLAGVEAGKLVLAISDVAVADIMQHVFDAMKPLAGRAGVRIEIGRIADLLNVSADPLRLRQVLIKLISDAIKYNRPGGHAKLAAEPINPNIVRFIVADNGIGIEPNRHAEIFQPFSRAGAELLGIDGTGIGLALSKQLVHAMSGRIGFTSRPGHGREFWIELPVADSGGG